MATKKTTSTTKKTVALEAAVVTVAGKSKGTVSLPESIFGLKWNDSLIHQVVTSMQANARTSVAHVKTRGEVRGGGKKPWQQKGTGRARHGSTRSPIWVGGGVTHGPRNDKDYSKKVNKKMRTKALFVALSRKLKDAEILFVDEMNFAAPKAKDAKATLGALSGVKGFEKIVHTKNAVLIAVPESNETLTKSFRNFGNVKVSAISRINPVEVLQYKHVVFTNPEAALAALESRAR